MDFENEDNEDFGKTSSTSIVHHSLNPDCPACSKPVFWKQHILTADRAWHVNCFFCCHCFKPLKPGEQSYYRGKIFCAESCFKKLFNLTNDQINAKIRNVLTKEENNYDKKILHCLNLNNKTKILENKKLSYFKETKINHKPLPIIKFFGNKCVRCSKPVYAAELCYSINFPWHLNCLRCLICNRILQPAAHAVHDGSPICNFPCYIKIYSTSGYRKGWQECRP